MSGSMETPGKTSISDNSNTGGDTHNWPSTTSSAGNPSGIRTIVIHDNSLITLMFGRRVNPIRLS